MDISLKLSRAGKVNPAILQPLYESSLYTQDGPRRFVFSLAQNMKDGTPVLVVSLADAGGGMEHHAAPLMPLVNAILGAEPKGKDPERETAPKPKPRSRPQNEEE